jgi:hypothetical protein
MSQLVKGVREWLQLWQCGFRPALEMVHTIRG